MGNHSKKDNEISRAAYPGLWAKIDEMHEKMKEIESQNQVIIYTNNNLRKEITHYVSNLAWLTEVLARLVDEPQTLSEATKLVKDFLTKMIKQ